MAPITVKTVILTVIGSILINKALASEIWLVRLLSMCQRRCSLQSAVAFDHQPTLWIVRICARRSFLGTQSDPVVAGTLSDTTCMAVPSVPTWIALSACDTSARPSVMRTTVAIWFSCAGPKSPKPIVENVMNQK